MLKEYFGSITLQDLTELSMKKNPKLKKKLAASGR
jgi:hypothetical protein